MSRAYLQALIDRSPSGGTATLPSGTFQLDGTLNISRSVSVVAARGGWCRLQWTGSAGSPMVEVTNSYSSTIEGLWLDGHATNTPSYGIHFLTTSGPTVSNSQVTLRRIRAGYGQDPGAPPYNRYFTIGIGSSGYDNGDDFHRLEDCYVRLAGTGYRVGNGQNTNWTLRDCKAYVCDVALRSASNINLENCFWAVSQQNDMLFDSADASNRRRVVMRGVRSEQGVNFIKASAEVEIDGLACGWQAYDTDGTIRRMIDLSGNLDQRVTMRNFELVKAGQANSTTVYMSPATGGATFKAVEFIGGTRSVAVTLEAQASGVAPGDERRLLLAFKDDDPVDVTLTRQETVPAVGTTDLRSETVRMGKRLANATGHTEVETTSASYTLSGVGDGSGVYDIADALPAGRLILGVTVRRDISTPLTPGTSSINVGTAADPDRWGANVLRAALGGGNNNRTTSADYTDGAPLWNASLSPLRITKLEGGSPGGSLNGVTLKVTVHSLRCVGAPE